MFRSPPPGAGPKQVDKKSSAKPNGSLCGSIRPRRLTHMLAMQLIHLFMDGAPLPRTTSAEELLRNQRTSKSLESCI